MVRAGVALRSLRIYEGSLRLIEAWRFASRFMPFREKLGWRDITVLIFILFSMQIINQSTHHYKFQQFNLIIQPTTIPPFQPSLTKHSNRPPKSTTNHFFLPIPSKFLTINILFLKPNILFSFLFIVSKIQYKNVKFSI